MPPDCRVPVFDALLPFVGDVDALMRLDTEPLPEEPFDWSAVEAPDRMFVQDVLALSDGYCELMLDAEYLTITRRILARVAARDPRALRRSTNVNRCAAGLVWLAGRANGYFGRRFLRSSEGLWAWFGVTDCAGRGRSLRRAAGLDVRPAEDSFPQLPLGDPTLLHSRFRGALIVHRDIRVKAAEAQQPRWERLADGQQLCVRAEPVGVVTVAKAVVPGSGDVGVFLALGHDFENAHFFALTITDAQRLGRKLQQALNAEHPSDNL